MTRRGEIGLSVLDAVLRLVLGGIFIYAAYGKIQEPAVFAVQVAAYRILPDFCVGLFALVLPMVELLAGLMLIATCWSREAALLILGLLGMFFIGLTQGLVRGLKISCGCFGDGGGEDSLMAALVRDLVLFVPTVWLVFRPNRWLSVRWPFLGAVLVAVGCCGWGGYVHWQTSRVADQMTEREPVVIERVVGTGNNTNTSVMAEQWTIDFPRAFAAACEKHRPIILFAGEEDCKYCQIMRRALETEAFHKWVRGTGIYLVEAHINETNVSKVQECQVEFLKSLPRQQPVRYPLMGVYWPQTQTNNDVRLSFIGRRGLMPGKKHPSVVGEFVNALELVLKDYLEGLADRVPLQEVLKSTQRQIQIKSEDGSVVWMEPNTGIQDWGTSVKIHVKPNQSGVRVNWFYPDGSPVLHQHGRVLTVNDDMPAGTYTVSFKKMTLRKASTEEKSDE